MNDRKQTLRPPDIRLGRTADRPYWVWMTSILIRALHQVGAAVFLAVFLLPGRPDLPRAYLVLAGVTGVLLMTTEMLRHRQLLREPAGLATLVKLVLNRHLRGKSRHCSGLTGLDPAAVFSQKHTGPAILFHQRKAGAVIGEQSKGVDEPADIHL